MYDETDYQEPATATVDPDDPAEAFWGDTKAFDLLFPDHPAARERRARAQGRSWSR